jgi:hypothetical protein
MRQITKTLKNKMNTYKSPYLQPYKNMSTRHTCPCCGVKNTFTLYLDGNTNDPINNKVGRCERESKCGYHYTPKQYFIDNPPDQVERKEWTPPTPKPIDTVRPIGVLPFDLVEKSASYKSNLVRFLFEFLTNEQIQWIVENYALGATKTAEVVFWQIDSTGKVRTGKIMQYNPVTGKRIKHESGAIDWVHNKLKKTGTIATDYNLSQCFFGEHLLKLRPDSTIAIVESEKSAIITSAIIPNLIWIAAGNLNGLSLDKCKVLTGRKVILYPDLGAFDKWTEKATEIQRSCNCKVSVSTLLEDAANEIDRMNGLDIADYIINQLRKQTPSDEIQNRFSPNLQSMIEKNNALLILIDTLDLTEVVTLS